MECKNCQKPLNEITLICDRCGVTVNDYRVNITDEIIEKKVLQSAFEPKYTPNTEQYIRNAYFLSHIIHEYSGVQREYMKRYIQLTMLRMIYEKHKPILMTKAYKKRNAEMVLGSFVHRKINQQTAEFIQHEFANMLDEDDFANYLENEVSNVYQFDFDVSKLKASKLKNGIRKIIFGNILKQLFIYNIIGAVLFVIGVSTFTNVSPIMFTGIFVIVSIPALKNGRKKGRNAADDYYVDQIIDKDKQLKKEIKLEMTKKYNDLMYRIKKGGYNE